MEEELELSTTEEPKIKSSAPKEQPRTIKVSQGYSICKWLNLQISRDTRKWKEEACKRFAENRLNVRFEYPTQKN